MIDRVPSEPSTRAAIERETITLIAGRGVGGTSLRQIADAVGIQSASLYNHYGNKEKLVAEVMASSMRRMLDSVRPIVEAGDAPAVALDQAIRAHVEFQGRHPQEAQVCREEVRSLCAEEAAVIVALRDEYELLLVRVVEVGVASGEFVSDDPRGEVRAMLEMWNSVAAWYRADGRMSLEEIGSSYAELALAALGRSQVRPEPSVPATAGAAIEPSVAAAKIRAVATRLFAARGYRGTSLRDLAEAAQVPSSTIYHHFSNKEEVLFLIMESTMVELLAVVRAAFLTADDAPGKLAAVVVAHVRFHGSQREAAAISDIELRSLSGSRRQAILAMRLEYESLFRSILAGGVAAGIFNTPDVDATVFGLIRMCSGVAAWHDPSGSIDLDRLADDYAALSLAMLGLTAHPPETD